MFTNTMLRSAFLLTAALFITACSHQQQETHKGAVCANNVHANATEFTQKDLLL